MPRFSTSSGHSHLVIETGLPRPDATTIVERKGLGHPDTLADHLAERLSRAYSRYTVEHFGAVLHHNFDKLALLGGASEVRYGAGRMTAPVRVLVNGRAAAACAAARAFRWWRSWRPRSGRSSPNGWPRSPTTSTSRSTSRAIRAPGAVLTGDGVPDRTRWFTPRSVEDLRERRVRLSNDTSLGTGWAPENPFESFVRELVNHFSGRQRVHPQPRVVRLRRQAHGVLGRRPGRRRALRPAEVPARRQPGGVHAQQARPSSPSATGSPASACPA